MPPPFVDSSSSSSSSSSPPFSNTLPVDIAPTRSNNSIRRRNRKRKRSCSSQILYCLSVALLGVAVFQFVLVYNPSLVSFLFSTPPPPPSDEWIYETLYQNRSSAREMAAVLLNLTTLPRNFGKVRTALLDPPQKQRRQRYKKKHRTLVDVLQEAGIYNSLDESVIDILPTLQESLQFLYGPTTTTTTTEYNEKNSAHQQQQQRRVDVRSIVAKNQLNNDGLVERALLEEPESEEEAKNDEDDDGEEDDDEEEDDDAEEEDDDGYDDVGDETKNGDNDNNNNNKDDEKDGPVIYGLDMCELYRAMVPNVSERYVAPAGLFNTGTNNLQYSLQHNIEYFGTFGARAYHQVPWGKHRLATKRLHHMARNMGDPYKLDHTKCLPIIIVRDPYQWMQSMCNTPYAVFWKKGPKRCPNLVPSKRDYKRFRKFIWDESKLSRNRIKRNLQNETQTSITNHTTTISHHSSVNQLINNVTTQPNRHRKSQKNRFDWPPPLLEEAKTFQVQVKFDKSHDIEYFDSLVELWNDWYRLYWMAEYPRILIRFEDMLLHAPVVIEQIATCMGLNTTRGFHYEVGSAKYHGSHTDFMAAILKAADDSRRQQGLTIQDKLYAARHLDSELMEAFQYQIVR